MAVDPIRVFCPQCGQQPGDPCITSTAVVKKSVHSVRQTLANNAVDDSERSVSITYDLVHCDIDAQHVTHEWQYQDDEVGAAIYNYLCDGTERAPVPGTDLDVPSGPYAIGSQHWPGVAKMIEECGEVSQALAKLIATNGDPRHWDGHEQDLYARISDELGDLTAAMIFLQQHNPDLAATQERVTMKLRWFETWHAEGRG